MADAGRYRATVSTPDGALSQGLDGEIGWTTTNNGVQRLSGANVARLRRIAMRYRPLKERPVNLQVVGVERIADGEVYVAAGFNASRRRPP